MKRIIFALLIAFASSITFTSCTEDEVTPQIANISSGATIEDTVVK